jgi:hypothetical protein
MAQKPNPENDEPVKIPLDPEVALRALLQVPASDDSGTGGTRDDKEPASG